MSATAAFVVEQAFLTGEPRCEYCKRRLIRQDPPKQGNAATGDHRIPRARGGPNRRWNIAVACLLCNQRKGPLLAEEFIQIRRDPVALKRKIREVQAALDEGRPLYRSASERIAAKQQRRNERLTAENRVCKPDPTCPDCTGSGVYGKRAGVVQYCRCSIRGVRGRARAAVRVVGETEEPNP